MKSDTVGRGDRKIIAEIEEHVGIACGIVDRIGRKRGMPRLVDVAQEIPQILIGDAAAIRKQCEYGCNDHEQQQQIFGIPQLMADARIIFVFALDRSRFCRRQSFHTVLLSLFNILPYLSIIRRAVR